MNLDIMDKMLCKLYYVNHGINRAPVRVKKAPCTTSCVKKSHKIHIWEIKNRRKIFPVCLEYVVCDGVSAKFGNF